MKENCSHPAALAEPPSSQPPTPSFETLNEPSPAAWARIAERPAPTLDDVVSASCPTEMVQLAWRLAQEKEGAAELRENLSLAFTSSLGACADETLGYAHAVVEAGRQQSLLARDFTWPQKICDVLWRAKLADLDPCLWLAIRGLADAYYAAELRRRRQLKQATALVISARDRISDGHPVIRARVLEVASSCAVDAGDLGRAASYLDEAADLVRGGFGSHLLPQIDLLRARLFARRGQAEKATKLLDEALARLPPGLDLRLRLEIRHESFAMHVASREAAMAEAVLEQSGWLYDHPVSDSLLVAKRDRLRGRLAVHADHPEEALGFLVPSLREMLRRGQVLSVLHSLDELREMLWRLPRELSTDEQSRLVALVLHLVATPTLRTAGSMHRKALLKLARDLGVGDVVGEVLGQAAPSRVVH